MCLLALRVSLTSANGSGPRIITLDEVQQHSTADDAWLVLDGRVYNITMFLRYHPGGQDILIKRAAGRDATALFNKYHPNVKAHNMLKKCLMGYLQQSDAAVDSSKSGNNVAKAAKSLFARLQL